jgi:hypothetical protein
MIGHRLITKQTPKEGIPVSKVTNRQGIKVKLSRYFGSNLPIYGLMVRGLS